MFWLLLLAVIQILMGVRVLLRMALPLERQRVERASQAQTPSVTIVIPVLNERQRLPELLDDIVLQPAEVREILIVDGGSSDGTCALIRARAAQDPRLQLIDASPIPDSVTGKAWGLARGIASARGDWVLMLDADTRVDAALTRSLLAFATREGVSAFSVATRQRVQGTFQAALHPSMLTTLVYRFGRPGTRTDSAARVQANGQCFFAERDLLRGSGAASAALDSLCEDVTMARHLVRAGIEVGFYEADDLITVAMYPDARTLWENWTRSLPMRDRYAGLTAWIGVLEVSLLMGLPLPLTLLALGTGAPAWFLAVQLVLLITRAGVLVGTARVYEKRPWSYWLSPFLDFAVALRLLQRMLQRRYEWRGRHYVRQTGGGFQLETRGTGGEK